MALAQDKMQSHTIDGRSLNLPLPPDSCDLDPGERRDRVLIQSLETIDSVATQPRRVLRRVAPCGELADWRSGRRSVPPDIIEMAHLPQRSSPGERPAWLRMLREPQPTATVEQLATRWSASEPDFVGPTGLARRSAPVVIDPERDERALYGAVLLRLPLAGQPVTLAGVGAWTMAGGTPVQLLALTAWEGDGSVMRFLSEEQRDLVDRVLAANGEERRRFVRAETAPAAERREPRERVYRDLLTRNAGIISIGLLVAGTLLVGIGIVGARTLRRRTA